MSGKRFDGLTSEAKKPSDDYEGPILSVVFIYR
jgi:hypothetical protein